MVEGGIDAGKFPHKSKNDKIKATITDMLTNCVPQSIDSLLAKLGEIDKSASDHVAAVYPKLKALHTDPNFTKMKDLKHSVASTLKAEEGIPFLRVEGKVPVGLMDFLGLLRNPEIHNKDSKGHELVKGYIAGVGLFREAVKAPWPVEDRDFSLINLIHFDEDGAIYYLRTSYDTPDLPPVKKHTRGEINALWKFVVVSPEETQIVFVGKNDPKGSIPSSFKDKSIKKQQGLLETIHEAAMKTF